MKSFRIPMLVLGISIAAAPAESAIMLYRSQNHKLYVDTSRRSAIIVSAAVRQRGSYIILNSSSGGLEFWNDSQSCGVNILDRDIFIPSGRSIAVTHKDAQSAILRRSGKILIYRITNSSDVRLFDVRFNGAHAITDIWIWGAKDVVTPEHLTLKRGRGIQLKC